MITMYTRTRLESSSAESPPKADVTRLPSRPGSDMPRAVYSPSAGCSCIALSHPIEGREKQTANPMFNKKPVFLGYR